MPVPALVRYGPLRSTTMEVMGDTMGDFPRMNPGPVCRLDLEGLVHLANPAAHAAFGEDSLLGRRWLELCPQLPEEAWEELVSKGTQTQHGHSIEGRRFVFTLAHRVGSDSVFAYGADVTELHRAQEALAEQADELRENALFPEMNPGPVARLDLDATVLRANAAAKKLFGDRLIGSCLRDLVPGISDAIWARILEGGDPLYHEADFGGKTFAFTIAHTHESHYVFVYGADVTELKVAERALQQSEKMATLGTLAAGVAHELNNPAAAVQRAAEHLHATFGKLQEAQLVLGKLSLSDQTLQLLTSLEARVRERSDDPSELDPVTRSDQEYEVECWLEDEDVEDGWELAPSLVGMGFASSELQELADQVPSEHLAAVVTWLSRTFPVYTVLAEIRYGAGRLSEIVGALKAYSYVGQAPVQAVDVNEGIRHTLIILRNKLKKGVAVDLDLAEDLPRIQAYGADLNQVWTNLIDNAADAMKGEGRLSIRSSVRGEWVCVEVEDDGPGIPPGVQGRVFDPFFTTKEPGEGTGLGLNTTYNIVVKKHGGRIGLESEPGRTCFTIELPLDPELGESPEESEAREELAQALAEREE